MANDPFNLFLLLWGLFDNLKGESKMDKSKVLSIIKTILYWVISCTWGILMTFCGACVALFMLITKHKPQKFHHSIYFVVDGKWAGGFNVGPFFILSHASTLSVKQHEAGHGIQNLMYGPLMPFIVAIPSAIRYWYREYLINNGKKTYNELPDYDSIWFEGQATALGKKFYPAE